MRNFLKNFLVCVCVCLRGELAICFDRPIVTWQFVCLFVRVWVCVGVNVAIALANLLGRIQKDMWTKFQCT